MINHDYSVLYNFLEDSPSGVPNFLDRVLTYPPGIARGMSQIRGNTVESADEFAIHALKLIDGSTYQSELGRFDSRITYRINELVLPIDNSAVFIQRAITVPPDARAEILAGRDDIATTFRDVDIQSERAAALLVGIIEKITVYNNA